VTGLKANAGPVGYHLFAGKPLIKPDELITDSLTTGFSLQWQF
jgi:hemolysin activation/secretion protein